MADLWRRYWGPERDEFSDRPGASIIPHLPWLDPCRRIADLGCGVGNLVARLQAQGKDAHGVTYQAAEVAAGRSKHGLDLTLADLHALPFADGSFDAMVMWDSLEHCVSPYVALCEARRVVAPGGRGLVFTPGPDWQDCRYHIIVPNRAQMEHLFKLSGWRLAGVTDVSTEAQPGMYVYRAVNDPTYRPTFGR